MKNKTFLLFIVTLLLTSYTGYSQDSSSLATKPERNVEFKGGLNGWASFLQNNLDRDLLRRKDAPSGKYTVVADFLVDSIGAVSDIKIITDPGYGTADEFIRILKLSSKKWKPAFDKGKNISMRTTHSLTFF
jgi:protein TonB